MYILLLFLFLSFVEGSQKWHTSQLSLRRLYDLQNEHFSVFNDYLKSETERLENLKKKLSEIYEWRDDKLNKNNTYFQVNSFKIMARIHYGFQKIEHSMCNKHSMEGLKKIDKHKDLSGDQMNLASEGLRRLQKFYEIPTIDMAAGKYKDRIIGSQLDACECYVITQRCFEKYDFFGSIDWGIYTYKTWTSEGGQSKCLDVEYLKYYIVASSAYTGFNYTTLFGSSKTNYYPGRIFAQHSFLMRDEIYYTDASVTTSFDIFDTYRTYDNYNHRQSFKRLCIHGESMRTLTKDSKCRYQTKNSTYRLLMPFKEEDLYNDPCIKMYHDIIYDNEIEKIKTLGSNNMADSGVLNTKGETLLIEDNRSGKTSRISKDDASKHLSKLNTRIETITGMITENAELYQVVNYGLGGHYTPHYDGFLKGQGIKPYGNRIVTVLFYMTGVHNDGYTVFPKLNIVSPAEKGAALLWHNLHHLTVGQIHTNSMHGSCPVLTGNKWIVTRWLYEADQKLLYNWRDNI